jgi:predicted GNAT superfamily acetyltransferase
MSGSRYRIVEEPIEGKQAALLPLLAAHSEEMTTDKALMQLAPDFMQLAPDFHKYIEAQKAGHLLVLFAYCGDELVGYSCTVIAMHMQYRYLMYAHNDLLFVAHEHRRAGLGAQLIKETTRHARERGAHIVAWSAKPDTALAKLLPKLGCRVHEIVFSQEV